jgi:PAS domain S-box-containing protein
MCAQATETPKTDKRLLPGTITGPPDLEFFRVCFSRFPDPVIFTDIDSRILYLNEAAQTFTGCASADENRLMCSDVLRGAEPGQESPIEVCAGRGTLDKYSVHFRNDAGEWETYLLSAQLVNDSHGNPFGCVFVLRPASPITPGLRDSVPEHIFASVIDNFPIPFFTVNRDLKITYMNDHLEKLTGFSRSEVVNRMSCQEVLRRPFCNSAHCLLKRAMEDKTSLVDYRGAIYDNEGRKIRVTVHCSMITDSENRVIGGFEALRDITPLIEAEQKIRMLVEITQEGILMIDENERVIYANSKMAEILEHPKDEMVGEDVGGLLPLQLRSVIRDLALRVDKEHHQEVRLCSIIQPGSNGEGRVFETCIIVSKFAKSFITCMYFHDLSKQIQIERELLSANSFLNDIIRSSADGIIVADITGKILVYNDSAERILGYRADEVIGVQGAMDKLISPQLAAENIRRMRSGDCGLPGKLSSSRITLATKTGEKVPVSYSAAIIQKKGSEMGTVSIFSDLREHLRMRRELEETRMQLMQAEKIASIGRLAAGIAHEINNPLSGILIYADILMRDSVRRNPQSSEDIQEIINQTMRCKEIVSRLLDFSRQSVDQRFRYDINAVIRRSAAMLSNQALFQDIEFVFDFQCDIPEMIGDPGQLQQVFTNLIINAGGAIKGKGRITLTSRFDLASKQVILEFADTGPGIPDEIISKVFEPFFTTKRPGEGTGLGLSVAYGIVQQHGGTIAVGNIPSSGALFTVALPLECPENPKEFTC